MFLDLIYIFFFWYITENWLNFIINIYRFYGKKKSLSTTSSLANNGFTINSSSLQFYVDEAFFFKWHSAVWRLSWIEAAKICSSFHLRDILIKWLCKKRILIINNQTLLDVIKHRLSFIYYVKKNVIMIVFSFCMKPP